MASSEGIAPVKKAKRKVESVKVISCDRCGLPTTHTLYDYDTKLYKCTICGEVHSPAKRK